METPDVKWAVTGAGGMLGTDLVQVLRDAGHPVVALRRNELDVTDLAACRAAVEGIDVVVNAAAWTDVDGAEAHEGAAFKVNAVGAANLARACNAAGAVMVQLSTDYVFAGDGVHPYRADDPVAPMNAYGRGKAAGEWAVRAECPRSYVVRTAWLYGWSGSSFVSTMLRLAGERQTVEVVDDQRGQPTWTRDLSAFVVGLVESRAAPGVVHGTSRGDCTWYEFARAIFRLTGSDPERVRATTSDRLVRPAARPAYSVLATDAGMPHWEDALSRALAARSLGDD